MIVNCFSTYFESLLNVINKVDENLRDQLKSEMFEKVEWKGLERCPDDDEINTAINGLKNNKAPGKDGIVAEMIKWAGEKLNKKVCHLIRTIWKEEKEPSDWKGAIQIPIYKNKGDKKRCDNFRGITLLPVMEKVVMKIILNRLVKIMDETILEEQCGFRRTRSTMDQCLR